jgi:hypothetical protein
MLAAVDLRERDMTKITQPRVQHTIDEHRPWTRQIQKPLASIQRSPPRQFSRCHDRRRITPAPGFLTRRRKFGP